MTASRDVARFSSSRGISFEEPTDDDMAARRTIIDTDPLRADPGLLPAAADEVLRWTCPTHLMRRTATADTVLGGAETAGTAGAGAPGLTRAAMTHLTAA